MSKLDKPPFLKLIISDKDPEKWDGKERRDEQEIPPDGKLGRQGDLEDQEVQKMVAEQVLSKDVVDGLLGSVSAEQIRQITEAKDSESEAKKILERLQEKEREEGSFKQNASYYGALFLAFLFAMFILIVNIAYGDLGSAF